MLPLLLLMSPHQVLAADLLELEFLLPFSNPVTAPHQMRTDMDCEREAGFSIRDAAYLKRDLKVLLKQKNIEFSKNAPYQLRLYVTHEDCGSNGEESYRSYPLGLGLTEKDFANAYLRIVAELKVRKSSEIISMHEYIAVARIEKNISRFLAFYVTAEEKQISKRELWKPLAKELSQRIAKDIRK